MGHEIAASVRVALPDAPQDMAGTLGDIATAWSEFLAAIEPHAADATFEVNQTRGRPGPKPANGTAIAARKKRNAQAIDEARGVLKADGQGPLPDPLREVDAP